MSGRAALLVAVVVLPIGAAIGAASYLAARVEYLLLVAPAAVGVAVGMTTAWAVRRQRLNRVSAAVAIALVGVMLSLVVHGWLDYRDEAAEQRQMAEDYGTGWDPNLGVATFLERRFGLDAEQEPGRLASALGPYGTIGLAAIELLLALGIAGWLARAQAREPSCPVCGQWRVERQLGSIAHGNSRELIARLTADRGGQIGELVVPPDTRERTRLFRMACPAGHDGGGGLLRVVDQARDRRGRSRHRLVADVPINEREVALICDALGSGE